MKQKLYKMTIGICAIIFLSLIYETCTMGAAPAASSTSSSTKVSLSVVPAAVFATAPLDEVTTSGAVPVRGMTRGSMTKEKITQLFMPIFTGFRAPKTGEDVGGNTGTTGNFLGIPVIIKIVAGATATQYKYNYYWYDPVTGPDDPFAQLIGYVVTDVNSSGDKTWTLYEQILNPFDPTEKFIMQGSGYYGSSFFLGSGAFKASSGNYNISAKLAWSQLNDKKIISVTDGQYIYTGDKSAISGEIVEVKDFDMSVSSDSTGAVVKEGSTIVTTRKDGSNLVGSVVTMQTVTKNDADGKPTTALKAGTRQDGTFNTDGSALSTGVTTSTFAKEYTVTVDAITGEVTGTADTGKAAATVATEIENNTIQTSTDDSTKSCTLTAKAGFIPLSAANKPIRLYVYKSSQIDYATGKPLAGQTPVGKTADLVSSEGDAELSVAITGTGDYVVLAAVDINGDDISGGNIDPTKLVDDFLLVRYGVKVSGTIEIKIGNPASGQTWMKNGVPTYNINYTSADFSSPQIYTATITYQDESSNPISCNGKPLKIIITKKTSWGEELEIGGGFTDTAATTVKVYANAYIDYAAETSSVIYIAGFIDMDNDNEVSAGDYGYNDLYMNGGTPLINATTTAFAITRFHPITALDLEQMNQPPFDQFSTFNTLTGEAPAMIPTQTYNPTTQQYEQIANPSYLATNTTGINGKINITKADLKAKSKAWFAVIMDASTMMGGSTPTSPPNPPVFGSNKTTAGISLINKIFKFFSGTSRGEGEGGGQPCAIYRIDVSAGDSTYPTFQFSKFNNASGKMYMIMILGYQSFTDGITKLHEPEPNDFAIVYKTITEEGMEEYSQIMFYISGTSMYSLKDMDMTQPTPVPKPSTTPFTNAAGANPMLVNQVVSWETAMSSMNMSSESSTNELSPSGPVTVYLTLTYEGNNPLVADMQNIPFSIHIDKMDTTNNSNNCITTFTRKFFTNTQSQVVNTFSMVKAESATTYTASIHQGYTDPITYEYKEYNGFVEFNTTNAVNNVLNINATLKIFVENDGELWNGQGTSSDLATGSFTLPGSGLYTYNPICVAVWQVDQYGGSNKWICGKLDIWKDGTTSYTLRRLTPGQNYFVAVSNLAMYNWDGIPNIDDFYGKSAVFTATSGTNTIPTITVAQISGSGTKDITVKAKVNQNNDLGTQFPSLLSSKYAYIICVNASDKSNIGDSYVNVVYWEKKLLNTIFTSTPDASGDYVMTYTKTGLNVGNYAMKFFIDMDGDAESMSPMNSDLGDYENMVDVDLITDTAVLFNCNNWWNSCSSRTGFQDSGNMTQNKYYSVKLYDQTGAYNGTPVFNSGVSAYPCGGGYWEYTFPSTVAPGTYWLQVTFFDDASGSTMFKYTTRDAVIINQREQQYGNNYGYIYLMDTEFHN